MLSQSATPNDLSVGLHRASAGVCPDSEVVDGERRLHPRWAWLSIPAILVAGHPGELFGTAGAGTLFDGNDPAGRLTGTFPRNVGRLLNS
jgi:hypothetical protein